MLACVSSVCNDSWVATAQRRDFGVTPLLQLLESFARGHDIGMFVGETQQQLIQPDLGFLDARRRIARAAR
jgi:hypothetical protein